MVAVLLMGFGGPDSLDAVEPFLANVMQGRKPSPEQVEKVRERYRLIGGRSPLLEITREQAEKLEARLNRSGAEYKVYVGMRYWHPYIVEAVNAIVKDGADHLAALSLSPFSSRVTTSAYLKELNEAVTQSDHLPFTFIDRWYNHPLFIDALAEKINEGLAHFSTEGKGEINVIFSAHSLPKEYVKSGDSYVEEIKETISLILEKIGSVRWLLGYQSKGEGRGEWLEPQTEDLLVQLAQEGREKMLIVPIGFASEHIETLYDLDILLRQKAEELGLIFHRVSSLNASPKFIEALARTIEERLTNRERE